MTVPRRSRATHIAAILFPTLFAPPCSAAPRTPITEATASTYTPAVSDGRHTLTVAVTATGTMGTATATSAATAPVASASGQAAPNWYTNGYPTPQYTCVTNYYVSTAGSDSNPGTLAHPWLKNWSCVDLGWSRRLHQCDWARQLCRGHKPRGRVEARGDRQYANWLCSFEIGGC